MVRRIAALAAFIVLATSSIAMAQYAPTSGSATLNTGTGTPGGSVTISGGGFKPGSTETITFESTPVAVGTATADANGNASATVKIPSGATAGTHTLVMSGPDPTGATHTVSATITIAAAGTTLARTGASGISTLLKAVIALAVIGLGLTSLSLNRRRAAQRTLASK